MRARTRWLLAGVTVAAISAIPLGAASAHDRGPSHATETAVGTIQAEIQEELAFTFKFAENDISVRSGGTLTFRNRSGFGEAHTLTVANKSLLPKTVEEIFNCGAPGTACEPAGAHFDQDGNIVNPIVNAGPPGLDEVGDSLAIQARGTPGDEVSVTVSARPGRTLLFLCAIHPWMQGTLEVEG